MTIAKTIKSKQTSSRASAHLNLAIVASASGLFESEDRKMKTTKELYDLINKYEAEQAPGSETSVLSDFVAKYGYYEDMFDEDRENEPITDDEYDAWIEAYEEHAQIEAEAKRERDEGENRG